MDGKALLWPKDGDLSSAAVIGVREGGLYKVPGHYIQAMVHDTVNPCELWHQRLGYLHYKALLGLQKMVKGMVVFHFEHDGICRGCVLGKNTKKSFPNNNKRSKGILDLIHSDICGPMLAPSLSGYLYYVLFIDDFSCKSWIYFLKAKNETCSKFQEFKALIENQIGKHVRALRTDNGGEFESHPFDDFCREAGIRRHLTLPYNSQQNGVVERKNKTICEATKAMMCDLDLPTSLWAEATSTAVYIQNISPHAILGENTPEEAFTGEKPEVGHLRIFDCLVYIHVPKEKRTKMEPFGKKGIFVGYNETSKAYRIYVPSQRHIKVSRDVTFHEEATFRRSSEPQFDTDMEEHETPIAKIPTPVSPRPDI
jgi:hypothetical protein